MNIFNFHRDCYDLLAQSINEKSVTFLIGARGSGKTVCLRQLKNDLADTVYVNFKILKTLGDKYNVLSNVKKAIKNNKKCIFLLDDITYVLQAESFIYDVSEAYSDCNNSNTKVVFCGGPPIALDTWATRAINAFDTNAGYVHIDFLTYSEFLRYKNISEISPETYKQFLYEASSFHKFDSVDSLKHYLKSCLIETYISNANTTNYIYNNDISRIYNTDVYEFADNRDTLTRICYMTLFDMLRRENYHDDYAIILYKLYKAFFGSYERLKRTSEEVVKQGFIFLKQYGLIDFSPVAGNTKALPSIFTELGSDDSIFYVMDNLFKTFYITVTHPMFHVQILKDILKGDITDNLPNFLFDTYNYKNALEELNIFEKELQE